MRRQRFLELLSVSQKLVSYNCIHTTVVHAPPAYRGGVLEAGHPRRLSLKFGGTTCMLCTSDPSGHWKYSSADHGLKTPPGLWSGRRGGVCRKTGSRPGLRFLVAWPPAQLSVSSQRQLIFTRAHENDAQELHDL